MNLRFTASQLLVAAVLLFLCGTATAESSPRLLVWKFDDLHLAKKDAKTSGINASVRKVADWADEHQTPISFGIICDTLSAARPEDIDWVTAHAVERGGRIEFWCHGWDHGRVKPADSTGEFKGTDANFQTSHLRQCIDSMRKATGITFTTFGAPGNAIDKTTLQALDACQEITVWLYGLREDRKRTVLNRTINLEYATGKVSYESFAAQYAKASAVPCLVLQGHPPYWGETDFAEFRRIADLLRHDGWITVTPTEAAKRLKLVFPRP